MQTEQQHSVATTTNTAREGGGAHWGVLGLVTTVLRLGYSAVSWVLPRWNHYEDSDPLRASHHFETIFEEQYGNQHPIFFHGSFSQAVQHAKRECKLLVVYLHSEFHINTPTFCRETLCSELFTECCNTNFVLWASSITTAEGYRVSNLLDVSTYPFIGIFAFDSTTLLESFEGMTDVTTVIDKLTNVLEAETPSLINARLQHEELERGRILREEQELAYQMALEADREKERKLREEEERLRALERAAKEAEEKKQREHERKMQNLPPEPKQGEGIQLVVKMPSGARLSRRFNATDKVQCIYDYVDVSQEEIESDTFDLVTNFPRKVFSDKNLSIEDVDNSKQILLLVSLK